MFQTQQTSLIRSWKQKKGKVGCDWEGRGSGEVACGDIARVLAVCLKLRVGGGVSPPVCARCGFIFQRT